MTTMTKTDLQQLKTQSTVSLPVALQRFEREIQLPANIDKAQFMLSARTIFTRVRDIEKCDPGSVVGALVQTAVLNLDPNPDLGLVYFVPRNNRNTNRTELEFKLGYRGLKEIVLRNPDITFLDTDIVFENDVFEVVKFAVPPIIHKPNFRDRGKPYAAYAVAKFRNEFIFEVITEKEAMDAKNRSDAKSSQYSPWNAQEESVRLEMWKKTAFRRLCKLLPLSVQKGIEIDDAVIPEKAIQTDVTGAVEINYTEVTPNVEYQHDPEPPTDYVTEEPAPEFIQQHEEVKQTVADANPKPKNMSDETLKRIEAGEVQCNLKIYKGGAFGKVFVKAKNAKYEDKGVEVYIQTAEQAARIEELAKSKKDAKGETPVNNQVADDLPF